jgi:hypothetical protein
VDQHEGSLGDQPHADGVEGLALEEEEGGAAVRFTYRWQD